MVHNVVPPCMTGMVPVGCVGNEDAGEVNAAVKITGTFTGMLALGDCGAADRADAGVALLTTGILSGVVAVEVLKLLSPEYVAPTETDGAGRDEVMQTASRELPTMPTAGAKLPLHSGIGTGIVPPVFVKLTVPVGEIGEPDGAITALRVTGVSTVEIGRASCRERV